MYKMYSVWSMMYKILPVVLYVESPFDVVGDVQNVTIM